jgi:M6 family metalloprotease-like protein
MKRFLITILIISAFARLSAVPAYPYPVVFTQPNGEQVTIIMKGDEFVRFAQTLDGFTLLYNDEGYFCYAQKNVQGDIVPSKFYAEEISNRSASANAFLAQTPTELRFSNSQVSVFQQIRDMVQYGHEDSRAFAAGEKKLLTILMQFPDKPFIKTQEEFHHLFNQVKYSESGVNGSVKDFFLEATYNQIEINTTVVGPFTANNNHAWYASRASTLAREGVQQAYASGVNFAEFAVGSSVPSIYMIFAGHGAEAGANQNTHIWSHASSISPSITYNGVTISKYACSPELRGNSGTSTTHIGVICHELGHNPFGELDYYDTNWNQKPVTYDGTGSWDLMAGGSWNDGGRTPAPPNPRSKVTVFGWTNAIELNSPQTVTIPAARIYQNAYFRINTQTNNEYFIIENKIRNGFDAAIPGNDLVIYRCAANVNSGGNSINNTSPQKFYPVSANAPVALPSSGNNFKAHYGSINSSQCSWPGNTGKTEFTDATIPAMVSWNNVPTDKSITNITKHDDYITFDFMGGGEKSNFHVFLPNYHGCTVTAQSGSTSPVNAGGSFSFTVDLFPSYNGSTLTVSVNHVELTPSGGVYTINNIQEDQIIRIEGLQMATFPINATVGENGRISPPGIVQANHGGVKTFEMIADNGYSVDSLFVDGMYIGNNKTYSFSNVLEPHTIHATFKLGGIYTIIPSIETAYFYTTGGVPSSSVELIISSPNGEGSVVVTAPQKFQISYNGTSWVRTFTIPRAQLPYKLLIRFNPAIEDTGLLEDVLTLKSTEAYAEVELFGYCNIGINDSHDDQNIVIYPNPTTGELRITSDKLQIMDVDIFDVYGKKLSSYHQIPSSSHLINISHLSPGIYFVKIKTETGTVTQKIIKH